MSVAIEQAQAGDLEDVLALLADVALPSEGVKEHFGQFLVARDGGRLVGCGGLERYKDIALLRSLAVAPYRQRDGIGHQLTARLLEGARSSGVREVVLLTTTAADFFTRHFGFVPAQRARFDEIFAASPEWHLPRCSSATCLCYQLARRHQF